MAVGGRSIDCAAMRLICGWLPVRPDLLIVANEEVAFFKLVYLKPKK